MKDSLVRALSVPWAKPQAIEPLIAEFRQVAHSVDPTGMGLRWTVGNALNVLFDDSASNPAVNLATTLTPGSMLVSNTMLNYTFSASGSLRFSSSRKSRLNVPSASPRSSALR